MRGQHPEFKEMLNCPAVNEWVIDSYSINSSTQRAALISVCEQCDVVNRSTKLSLVDKCKRVLSDSTMLA
jgi:hypothetical protein